MKSLHLFSFLWVIFALLDLKLDSQSGSGSTAPIASGPGSETMIAAYVGTI
jgi:hypothetical protein